MERVEKYVRAIAIDFIGADDNLPLTELQLAQLEFLTKFGLAVLRNQSAQQNVPAELLSPAANDVEDDAWVKNTQIP